MIIKQYKVPAEAMSQAEYYSHCASLVTFNEAREIQCSIRTGIIRVDGTIDTVANPTVLELADFDTDTGEDVVPAE